ncbi:MAG: methionine--tRNA ligase [Clostridia bacterium]|nr:methionine--tRNA ligase [Clostridia bacterium]MDY4082686.1 methionine--tRNA ligase [Eubacteriales bacterium]
MSKESNMAEKFYITTPIYYPSGKWHIGTCYTTIVCDAIARFKRMQGVDVFYLTGTDEHGQKIQKVAQAAGVPVKEYIDKIVGELKDLWKLLDISYDKFIRTTDEYHEKAVQKIFNKLYEQGDIYKSEYEGWYCTPCEAFWTKSQLVDGKCPDCGRPVELMKEESYFFKMSKYQDRIIKLIEENPDFLQPVSRQNEMLNNFLRPGLQDLCVSRTSFDWGIKVPFDPKHVVYVWLDALTNYITALGYGSDDTTLFDKYWPADIHMMGKEIVRFHSIIWPAILMALDIPLPKKVYGHGWLKFGTDKMSKSKGNVVDPFILCDRYGVDALRYYMLREVQFGQDGSYTNESFIKRINSDLTNELGNLVSRVTAMVTQYFGGQIPAPNLEEPIDKELKELCQGLYGKLCNDIDQLAVPQALEHIWEVIQRANKYIDETTPWILAKSEDGKVRLATVMYNLCEAIRYVATTLRPFLTKTPDKIFAKLGIEDEALKSFDSLSTFGATKVGTKVDKGEALFVRYDLNKELAYMDGIIEEQMKQAKAKEEKQVENAVTIQEIGIEEFEKVQLKVGTIVECEKVPKADKLLCSKVDLGEGSPRTIVSGIAKYYTPEEMVGKQVVVVTNLKPVKLRGIESQGMVLCASDDEGNLTLISPAVKMKSGSEIR